MAFATDRVPGPDAVARSARDGDAARPLREWFEEDGAVLWWRFPVEEAPWVGQPHDCDWPGYHTHWTPIAVPVAPGECGAVDAPNDALARR